MKLAIIAALSLPNRVIGREGKLPWHLSEDLKRFKRLTLGHPVIMGRKTYESLPKKPLPGRPNIVISRNGEFHAPEATVCSSLKQAVGELAADHGLAYVIGGASLFAEALAVAEGLHLTLIHQDFPGDAFFPEIDFSRWRETGREKHRSPEGWDYEFVDWEKA
jgi:dihydrofolate reductase